ncbi:MAG: RDD family protein, partial [Deltaproteobacteria bacterium]|nr:RDD family protein [Nannocystaceae bacterium]
TIAAIDALVARMMAPAPADRFTSYDELLRAIDLASVEHQRPAGLWVRSMATLIDLLIASFLAVAILVPLNFLVGNGWGKDEGPYVFLIYALYGTVLVARNGRTPGGWLFELEVVDAATGNKPTLRRAAIRAAVPLGVPTLGMVITEILPGRIDSLTQILTVGGCAAIPIALVWASLRSLTKQTVWDRASHTLVRYRTRRTHAIPTSS